MTARTRKRKNTRGSSSSSKKKKTKKKKTTPVKSSAANHPPYIRMVFEAISATPTAGKGASRAAIANYMKANYEDLAIGSHFNASLRRALRDGCERGVLVQGTTIQRWKLTDVGRKERKLDNTHAKLDAAVELKKQRKKLAAKKRALRDKEAEERKEKRRARTDRAKARALTTSTSTSTKKEKKTKSKTNKKKIKKSTTGLRRSPRNQKKKKKKNSRSR